jgi:hypothetical protein
MDRFGIAKGDTLEQDELTMRLQVGAIEHLKLERLKKKLEALPRDVEVALNDRIAKSLIIAKRLLAKSGLDKKGELTCCADNIMHLPEKTINMLHGWATRES